MLIKYVTRYRLLIIVLLLATIPIALQIPLLKREATISSLVDLLKRINYVLYDNDSAFDRLAEEVETVRYTRTETVEGREKRVEKVDRSDRKLQNAQFLLLYKMSSGDTLDQYVDGSFRIGRGNVRLRDMSSRQGPADAANRPRNFQAR